ncbi:hypothetical protein C7212DRAFT_205528, partial [Tuber magnatum]
EVTAILHSFSTDNTTICMYIETSLLTLICFHCSCYLAAVFFSSHLYFSLVKASLHSKRQAISLLRYYQSAFPFTVLCQTTSCR